MTTFGNFMIQAIFMLGFFLVWGFGMSDDLEKLSLTVVSFSAWYLGEFYGRMNAK